MEKKRGGGVVPLNNLNNLKCPKCGVDNNGERFFVLKVFDGIECLNCGFKTMPLYSNLPLNVQIGNLYWLTERGGYILLNKGLRELLFTMLKRIKELEKKVESLK